MIGDLYAKARTQDIIIFQKPGLTVYAAPWDYALCTKLDRLSKPGPAPYDMDDAVTYLGNIIEMQGSSVMRQELETWIRMYHLAIPLELLRALNEQFR
jgi:hypothetical protein